MHPLGSQFPKRWPCLLQLFLHSGPGDKLWYFLAFWWVKSEGKRGRKKQQQTLQTEGLGSTIPEACDFG